CFFFFQAEDGIRDYKVTGVQTCALPISDIQMNFVEDLGHLADKIHLDVRAGQRCTDKELAALQRAIDIPQMVGELAVDPWVKREIGRASCRERVEVSGGVG